MAMDPISSNFNQYVDQVSQIGDKFGPLVVKAMVLLVVVLFLTKFLGRFLALILSRFGMPERRAIVAVTILHVLVLLLAALIVLNMLGFPGILLFRTISIIVMVGLAILIICKPYIPQLPFQKGDSVKVGATLGKVEKVTFMHTLIRTFDGKMVFIPNHKVRN